MLAETFWPTKPPWVKRVRISWLFKSTSSLFSSFSKASAIWFRGSEYSPSRRRVSSTRSWLPFWMSNASFLAWVEELAASLSASAGCDSGLGYWSVAKTFFNSSSYSRSLFGDSRIPLTVWPSSCAMASLALVFCRPGLGPWPSSGSLPELSYFTFLASVNTFCPFWCS
jgi:hypothetical protein